MAVSRKAMTEGLSKWASSDPLSLVLAGDARDSSPWSARGAFGGQWPPLLILTIVPGEEIRIVTGGNPWKGPHQRALHYGMTATGSHCNFNSLRGAPLVRNDSIYRNALQERYRACTQWSVDYRPTGARIARRGSRQKDVPQKCGTPFGKGFGKNRISRRRR